MKFKAWIFMALFLLVGATGFGMTADLILESENVVLINDYEKVDFELNVSDLTLIMKEVKHDLGIHVGYLDSEISLVPNDSNLDLYETPLLIKEVYRKPRDGE